MNAQGALNQRKHALTSFKVADVGERVPLQDHIKRSAALLLNLTAETIANHNIDQPSRSSKYNRRQKQLTRHIQHINAPVRVRSHIAGHVIGAIEWILNVQGGIWIGLRARA